MTAAEILKRVWDSTNNWIKVGISAGTNLIGKVSIDQTTDGTTNKVQARNSTHDNFNTNSNLQINDTDVSLNNPINTLQKTQDIGTVTSSKVTVSTSTTQILAANANRVFLTLTNNNNYDVWIKFGESAVLNEGMLISAFGGNISFTRENIYKGAINGIASSNNDIAYSEGAD